MPFGCGCEWEQRPKNARTEARGVVRRSSEPRGLRESRCALTLGIAGDPWFTGMRREAPVQSDEQGGLETVREAETKRED